MTPTTVVEVPARVRLCSAALFDITKSWPLVYTESMLLDHLGNRDIPSLAWQSTSDVCTRDSRLRILVPSPPAHRWVTLADHVMLCYVPGCTRVCDKCHT